MIGEAAAHLVEEIVPAGERIHEIVEARDGRAAYARELLDPGIEQLGQMDVERLIGAKGGEHLGGETGSGQRLVAGQVVGGIVGGAEGGDVELAEDALGAQFVGGQQFVGAVPDALRARFVEQFVDAEVALQLQVRPVIQRVAQGIGHGAGPGQELLVGVHRPGAKPLVHAVGAHGAPLVMVALQPDFEQVGELPVAGQIERRQVAMIIQNGLPLGVLVIEPPRGFVAQQKIVVDERHGPTASNGAA